MEAERLRNARCCWYEHSIQFLCPHLAVVSPPTLRRFQPPDADDCRVLVQEMPGRGRLLLFERTLQRPPLFLVCFFPTGMHVVSLILHALLVLPLPFRCSPGPIML